MVHTNSSSNCLNQTTVVEQGFGATVFSGRLDDVARQRGDGVPQVRPQGCFSRLPLRQRKQQPALVSVNGQPAKVMSEGGSAPYTFEALVDLAEGDNTVTIEAEDGDGNVATQSYSATAGGVQLQLEYDLNGNLRYEKDASGTVLRAFQWDAKNRLVKIIDGTHVSEFEYDALDRRVRIVEKENAVVQSDETYLWVDGDILQKRASNGQTVLRSYFADGFEEGSIDYFVTRDHLGSVREVIASNGTTVESVYEYTAWGEPTKTSGTGVESDFLYTGHFYHPSSDLHLALYRAYNSELGRWLSRDPIARVLALYGELLPEGPSLYSYVSNDPIALTDETGLIAPWLVSAGIGGLVSGGLDLAGQLVSNGGNWDCVSWGRVGKSAALGAATSFLTPTGGLLGRGGSRAAQYGYNRAPGLVNRGNTRFGWSRNRAGQDQLALRRGSQHRFVPGTNISSGARPVRDGLGGGVVGGALGDGIDQSQGGAFEDGCD